MEHAGLDQDRRALVASPVEMSWEWPQANQLVLTFSLAVGNYATSVLNEILRTTEPDRHTESESAAVE
jgi:tRNA pseudouridine13 synthase